MKISNTEKGKQSRVQQPLLRRRNAEVDNRGVLTVLLDVTPLQKKKLECKHTTQVCIRRSRLINTPTNTQAIIQANSHSRTSWKRKRKEAMATDEHAISFDFLHNAFIMCLENVFIKWTIFGQLFLNRLFLRNLRSQKVVFEAQ